MKVYPVIDKDNFSIIQAASRNIRKYLLCNIKGEKARCNELINSQAYEKSSNGNIPT